MPEQKRVLHVVASTSRAGVEMALMNLYRRIDRQKLRFDFVAHDRGNDDLSREIEEMGGRVFKVPLMTRVGVFRFMNTIYRIIRDNGPYIALHTHTDHQGGFCAAAAKKAGVPLRICHAHTDTRSLRSAAYLAKRLIGRFVINLYATRKCACSENAAAALFGRRAVKKGEVTLIKNGVELSGFADIPARDKERIRAELGACGREILIGYVGRLSPEKNPGFIIEMAKESAAAGDGFRFAFAGDGVLADCLKKESDASGVSGRCVFLGTREDAALLMQCFDIVVVPSLSEGFSLVCAEAQAAGTPVLAASCVPAEADMGLGLFFRMSLRDGAHEWLLRAREIVSSSKRPDEDTRFAALRKKGHDVSDNVGVYMRLYGLG